MSESAHGPRLNPNFRIESLKDLPLGLQQINDSVHSDASPELLHQIAHDIRRLAGELDEYARLAKKSPKRIPNDLKRISAWHSRSEMTRLVLQGATISEVVKRYNSNTTRVQDNINRVRSVLMLRSHSASRRGGQDLLLGCGQITPKLSDEMRHIWLDFLDRFDLELMLRAQERPFWQEVWGLESPANEASFDRAA